MGQIPCAIKDWPGIAAFETVGLRVPLGQPDRIANLHRDPEINTRIVQQLSATNHYERIGQGAAIVKAAQSPGFQHGLIMNADNLRGVAQVKLQVGSMTAVKFVPGGKIDPKQVTFDPLRNGNHGMGMHPLYAPIGTEDSPQFSPLHRQD